VLAGRIPRAKLVKLENGSHSDRNWYFISLRVRLTEPSIAQGALPSGSFLRSSGKLVIINPARFYRLSNCLSAAGVILPCGWERINKWEAIMKRINEGKVLLTKAKTEAKKQDKRRLKRQVKRQAKSQAKSQAKKLVGIAGAPPVTSV